MKLSDKALLVQLNVSQWTARKLDKNATTQVAIANNTGNHAGRYNKSLLPMNEYLDNVHKKTTLIRKEYYHNTLPWGIDGTMILPTDNYLDFMAKFRQYKSEWEMLVDNFLVAYPQLQLNAQRYLGDLFNPNDYPSADVLRCKFSMDMTVLPVPSNDFRVGIDEQELADIQQQVEARVQQSTKVAMQEAWQRLYDKVKSMAERLSDTKAVFRDTLITNIQDVCDVLKRLNVTGDEDLENMRLMVEDTLANNNPESLRLDLDLRKKKSSEAKDILDRMGAFMGQQ
jgi:hypothetical protein